ncbi:MAG: T9SS type A sorting domain-containing protein, partial [Bacteroidales bacterium]|nr:T9SS type A sorting domain-containing protein [Bacteroidales bacterium]
YIDKLYFRQFPTIINNNPVICEGQSVVLTVSGGVGYTWNWNNTETGSAITVNPNNTSTYTVVGIDGNGFTNQTWVVVTVNPAPNVDVNSPNICSGETATLTASGASFYSWDNGLGAGNPKTVNPTTGTVYHVTGTDTHGCTNEAQANVNVNSSPSIAVNDDAYCPGGSATLTASGGIYYTWSTGATTNNIVVSPSVTTTYSVTGSGGNGCTNVAHGVVTVYDLPNIIINQPTICPGNSAVLTASGASLYSWDNGLGLGNSFTVSPTANTTYTVTGVDANSCTNTAQSVVHVSSSIVVTVNSPTICSGNSATLIASGANTYTWSTFDEGEQIIVNPSTTTTYYVTGSAGAGTACSNTAVTVVTVNPSPTVTSSGGNTICEGVALALHASGASTYSWSDSQTGSSITVAPTTTTTFTVTGTTNGCHDISSQVVVVNPKPIITANNPEICTGNVATLTASGALAYVWDHALGMGNPKTVSPTVTTTYLVTGVDASTCSNVGHAVVTVHPLPTISANSPSIIQGNSATLTASGGLVYTWSNGMNSNPITVSPTVTTTYFVTGVDGNGCMNTAISVVQVTVGVKEHFAGNGMRIYPNPNNGNFILEINSASKDDIEIRVMNLLGIVVYQEKNVTTKGGLRKEISLVDKSEGIYIVTVIGSEGAVNRTIVVKR